MTVPDTFSAYYADLLQGTYDCLDRIVLNAFYPLGQTAGGMRTWWRHLHGDDSKLNDDRLRDMAGTFSRRLHAFCAKQGIPIIEAQAGDRKHELAEPYLPKDRNFCGLFLVIKGIAPAPVWEVKRNADGQITEIRHRKNWPYVKHFYFHLIDSEWGHVSIRMCSYPPFGAQVILNGHEWVERQAWRKKVVTVKDGNCFVEGSDFPGIDRLAAELNRPGAIGRLRKLCERWIYSSCLCFALPSESRKRTGFAYQYSVFQLELSRNLLFLGGTTHVAPNDWQASISTKPATAWLSTQSSRFPQSPMASRSHSWPNPSRSVQVNPPMPTRPATRPTTWQSLLVKAGASDRAITSLRSRSFWSADLVCLPSPTGESHQTLLGWCHPPLSPIA
jgi:hypothetical protein